MKKEDFITVIIDDSRRDQPRGLFARFLRAMGNTIGWLFVLCPGCLIIWLGLGGILNKRLEVGRQRTVSYCDEAIGLGCIFIGVGFWALGQGVHFKTDRVAAKVAGWVMACITVIVGVAIFFRRFWIPTY